MPPVGLTAVCSGDEVSGGSPVTLTHCSFGGYDPGAEVTVADR